MQRIAILMLLSFVALGGKIAAAQDDEKPLQKLFRPIMEFRTRHCNPNPVKGCMCAKCKAKRQKKLCERCVEKAKKVAEKEKEKQQLILDLEKLALEMKKLQKEKEDFEEEITWDITDEKESENELLKMAAAAKADQDLAPKKIEALQYIAGLGCAKVPEAPKIILAGLKDANVDVRAAAVHAILSPYLMPYGSYEGYYGDAVQFEVGGCAGGVCSTACCPSCQKRRPTRQERKGCDFCKYQENIDAVIAQLTPDCTKKGCCEQNPCQDCQAGRSKRRGKLFKCGFCRGRGCKNCKFRGSVESTSAECCQCLEENALTDDCQCQPTDACQACCSEEIQAELKEMAFGTKDNGCFYEPNENVRLLAAQALEMCPGLPPKDITEEADTSEESDVTEEPVDNSNGSDASSSDENGDDASTYLNRRDRNHVQPVSSRRNYDDEEAGPLTHTFGLVDRIGSDNSVVIALDGDYMIPENFTIEIETVGGARYEGIVTASEIGSVTIQPTSDPIRVKQGEKLRFGVVAAYPEGI